jgi:hypothetical protein
LIKYQHNENLVTKFALEKYIGKIFNSKNCGEFVVVGIAESYKYRGRNMLRYICRFNNTGSETLALGNAIDKGNIRDNYAKVLCNIGYPGDIKGNYSKHFLFKHWRGMIERCYNTNYTPYREEGEVTERWHCFANFIVDSKLLLGYKEMAEHPKIKFSLDKDYIIEGNQIYSKENCCFLPQDLNSFILNTNKNREYKFEGIYLRKDNLNFRASVRFNGKTKNVLESNDPIIVHDAYWEEKCKIAAFYFNNSYSFLSNEIRNIIYNRIKLKEMESKKELLKAINNNYFEELKLELKKEYK